MADVTPKNFQDTPYYGGVATQNKGQDNVILTDGSGNALFVHGTTVPTDGDSGYAVGCFFADTDGGNDTAIYVNEGSNTSANFNKLTVQA